MATFDEDAFKKRLREAKERDPEWLQFGEEKQRHYDEWSKLNQEVKELQTQKERAGDEDSQKEIGQQIDLKSTERELAASKNDKAACQQAQRQCELMRQKLLQELKTANNDVLKSEIERRLQRAEAKIREYSERVKMYESRAAGHEERLGLLKKEESKRTLEEALKRGYLLLKLFTSVIVGAPGVGKTLLKHLLLGKKPPTVRSSTVCLEHPIKIRSVSSSKFRKQFGKWMEVNPEQLLPMIGRYIRRNVKRLRMVIPDEVKEYLEQLEMSTGTTTSETISSATASSDGSSTAVVGGASISLASDDEPKSPASQEEEATVKEMIDSIFGTLEKLISGEELKEDEVEELFSSIWVYVTDSGGQPQFHELLPLFIHDISSLIFVSHLSDRLDDRPPDEYYQDGDLVGKRSCTHLTTSEQVKCLTRSLLTRSVESKPPNVIMVGTHLDKAGECDEDIDQKDAKLLQLMGPQLQKHLIYYKGVKNLIFPVNCLHPTQQDTEVAKLIQEAVESAVVKEVKVPIWWFLLELLIQGLASKLKKRVLSRKFCASIAHALGFTEKAFDAALTFFDELNVIKYSKALPDVVFADSQVPLDNLSDLVQESYLLRHGQSSSRKGDWKRFCDEGIVTLEFLNSTCKHFEEGLFESRELLKLLETQLVVVPLKSSGAVEYFMPALLDILPLDELDKQRVFSSIASPLLFRFSHGCRRAGVFCSLVVYLMKESKWSIVSESRELMFVSRNCITFSLPSCTCVVTLVDAFYHFEAHVVESTVSVCHKACPTIREEVLTAINAACEKMKYSNDRPQLAFFCQHPATTGEASSLEAKHAAVVKKEDDCFICTQGRVITKMEEQHNIWLLDAPQDVTTDQDHDQLTLTKPVHNSSLSLVRSHVDSSPEPAMKICQQPHLIAPVQPRDLVLIKWKGDQGQTQRFYLMENISHKWRTIGELLNLPFPKLESIATEHRDKPEDCCRAVLGCWLENSSPDYPATWQGLIELLEDCKLREVATQLEIILKEANL